jgi:hypothetical protein
MRLAVTAETKAKDEGGPSSFVYRLVDVSD